MRTAEKEFQENLNFYHTHLQFNPPYPVLLDASFICSIIANRVNDMIKYLMQNYDRKFKFFTTSCIVNHLKRQYPNNKCIKEIVMNKNNEMQIYPCAHEYSAPATTASTYACIYGIACQNQYKKAIGPPRCKQYIQKKEPRVIVATQNLNLVEALRDVIGVPLMYFENGAVNLERPSEVTLKMIEIVVQRKQEMIAMEMEILAHAVEDEEMEPGKKCKHGKESSESHESDSIGAKRKRELSPDICDCSSRRLRKKKALEFDMYKTLCRETDDDENRRKQESRTDNSERSRSTPRAASSTNTFLFTNTSSFECDTNCQ